MENTEMSLTETQRTRRSQKNKNLFFLCDLCVSVRDKAFLCGLCGLCEGQICLESTGVGLGTRASRLRKASNALNVNNLEECAVETCNI